MRVTLLGSLAEGGAARQYASSYVINGEVAIDAGLIGFVGRPEEQGRIRHVFLTHSHMDHIASLPVFLENVLGMGDEPPVVWASRETLAALRAHVFNDVVWPDFLELTAGGRRFVETRELAPEETVEVGGLRITAVPVNHIVPALGFVVTDGASTVAFGADSGPTGQIWRRLAECPAPRSVFLECTFPDEMAELARVSAHHTPASFGAEVRKMPAMRRVLAMHLKPAYRAELERQLGALGVEGLEIVEPGGSYEL